MSPEGPSANPAGATVPVLNDRFEVGERLAEGTFFNTHRGRDIETGHPVAIKILKPEYGADAAFSEAILAEFTNAKRLRHANIALVHDAWRERGTIVAVTEFVRGINLKDRIRRVAPFPLAVSMDILLACTQALQFAHENGIVHGDIRPDNILITPDGRVKLTDFGIGPAVAASSKIQLNALPQAATYMAPEVAEGKPQDNRSDLYSLGCLAYEMLSGSVPFEADSPLALAVKHLKEPVPSLKKANSSIPNAVDGMVAKCLQKDPADRYAGSQALLEDIHRIREGIRTNQPLNWTPLTTKPDVKTSAPAKPAKAPRPPRPERFDEPAVDTGPSIKLLVGVFVLGLVMIGAFFGLVLTLTSAPGQVNVPSDLVNMPQERAIATLQKLGLKAEVVSEYSTRPVGMVIKIDPPGGTEIRAGKAVTLMVSKGSEPLKAPTVVDKDLATAKKMLAAAGLKPGDAQGEYSDVIDKGHVISQNPAGGAEVQKGGTVALTVSKGPAPETASGNTETPEKTDGGDTENPDKQNPDNSNPDSGNPDNGSKPPTPTPNTDPSAELPASKNEVGFPISSKASGPQHVRIMVKNEDGTEINAYEQDHKAGDQVHQTVTVYAHPGKGEIRVFLNDRVIYRETGPPFK